jgi:sugar phosphate isomerase/epimerase
VRIFADVVKRILEAAEDADAALAVETHGYQGTDPDWLQGVLDAVASPRLGVTLDPANYYLAGHSLDRVYEFTCRFASRVCHTHCKNLSFAPMRRNAPRPPGWGYGEHVCPLPDGDLDYHRIAGTLHSAGYRGPLCLEEEALGKFSDAARREVLRRDADYLREVVRAVAPADPSPV